MAGCVARHTRLPPALYFLFLWSLWDIKSKQNTKTTIKLNDLTWLVEDTERDSV